ncbi:MAG: hypothetical protein Q9194_005858 [Teloschistes cf. exilis]
MESLGLDSLIVVESEAWIAQTLHAAMQTSEILDTPNLWSYASTARRRSSLFGAGPEVQGLVKDCESADGSETEKAPIADAEEFRNKNPPRPPLIELGNTLQPYLSSIRAFCSEEQFKKNALAVGEFQKLSGIRPTLQERLIKWAQDPRFDSWLYDLYNTHIYCKQRAPINSAGLSSDYEVNSQRQARIIFL